MWAGTVEGKLEQITHLNRELEQIRYGETEEVDWKARDGWEITGLLVKPVDY